MLILLNRKKIKKVL